MPSFADRIRQLTNDPKTRAKVERALNKVQEQARKPENQQRITQLRDRLTGRGKRPPQ
jgi:type II secretory pathway component PulF